MTWPVPVGDGAMVMDDSPATDPLPAEPTPSPVKSTPVDPKDPEGFLRRCSGVLKKTSLRCSVVIGKKTHLNTHPTYLPTCSAHRDQRSLAGWCQYKPPNQDRCGRLFRWIPPSYFELCDEHQGYPGTPCYLLKQLPLELRHEIYRYLLPSDPIGSSTITHHQEGSDEADPTGQRLVAVHRLPNLHLPQSRYHCKAPTSNCVFPTRLANLLLVSHKVHDEIKELLFSIATFKVDVRRDGTFMCGRRLLEPKRADGSSHVWAAEADDARNKFLKTFNWGLVKNYNVDILLENWVNAFLGMGPAWDEEVEIYDIRDYISVVVSGILAKAHKLCKLQVRLCLSEFQWSEEQIFFNSKILFEPFERLRNVRHVSLGGVYQGRPEDNSMLLVSPHSPYSRGLPDRLETCSVPSLPTNDPIHVSGIPGFDVYISEWRDKISSKCSTSVTEEPPIRRMFAEFRNLYTQLSSYVPDIMYRNGKKTFLHRARVAREHENVVTFREIQNELVHYWTAYLLNEEDRKRKLSTTLSNLIKSDRYPFHIWEETSTTQVRLPPINSSSMQSPTHVDANRMVNASMPMAESSVVPQPDTDAQAFQEAEMCRIRTWSQNVNQSLGRLRPLLPRPVRIDNPAFLAECSAKLAKLVEPDVHQQAPWQQPDTTRDGWERFDARMRGEESSASTIIADNFYNATYDSHYTAPEGEAGPSTKRRRIDYEPQSEMQPLQSTSESVYPCLPYSGKGKEKAPVQASDDEIGLF